MNTATSSTGNWTTACVANVRYIDGVRAQETTMEHHGYGTIRHTRHVSHFVDTPAHWGDESRDAFGKLCEAITEHWKRRPPVRDVAAQKEGETHGPV